MIKFEKVYSVFESKWLGTVIGGFCVLAAMIYVSANVVGRYIFKCPMPGMNEIVGLLMVPLCFLTFSYGWKCKGTFICVELVTMHLKPGGKRALAIFVDFVTLLLFMVPLIIGGIWGTSGLLWSYSKSETVGTVGSFTMATWPFKLIMILGCVFMCIRIVLEMIHLFRRDGLDTCKLEPEKKHED